MSTHKINCIKINKKLEKSRTCYSLKSKQNKTIPAMTVDITHLQQWWNNGLATPVLTLGKWIDLDNPASCCLSQVQMIQKRKEYELTWIWYIQLNTSDSLKMSSLFSIYFIILELHIGLPCNLILPLIPLRSCLCGSTGIHMPWYPCRDERKNNGIGFLLYLEIGPLSFLLKFTPG